MKREINSKEKNIFWLLGIKKLSANDETFSRMETNRLVGCIINDRGFATDDVNLLGVSFL